MIDTQAGRIKKWVVDRGFGFIAPDNGGDDLFVHITQIRSGARISEGDLVTYECGLSERNGKPEAKRVTVTASAAKGH